MQFVYPQYWYFWLGLPVLIAVLVLVYRRSRRALDTWFQAGEYKYSLPGFKLLLRIGGLSCLLIALLGPYESSEIREVEMLSREVYVLMDISASMHTADIRPSRLGKAKRELKNLVEDLKGDKIGLIVFADYAYVQCPLTRDPQAVKLFLELAQPEQFAQRGTQYRPALAQVLDRFLSSEAPPEDVSRVVVLVSDGEDHGQTYASVASRLQQLGVTLFSVGVGTYEGGKVPIMQEGEVKGYKTLEDGSPVYSRLQDESLKNLSDQFGTPFYLLDGPTQSLRPLARDIRMIQPASMAVSQEQIANNRYQLFLLPGLAMLLLSMFIMPIQKKHVDA
jgi:Ca-activated chloride channel family protein